MHWNVEQIKGNMIMNQIDFHKRFQPNKIEVLGLEINCTDLRGWARDYLTNSRGRVGDYLTNSIVWQTLEEELGIIWQTLLSDKL